MKTGEAIARLEMVCLRQHKADSTRESYRGWLIRYMAAVREMPNELDSEAKLERFLTELALRGVSASTQNQAFNAILFFYQQVIGTPLKNVSALRARRPARVRHAPTLEETAALMRAVGNVGGYPTNLLTRLLYACGLRVTEPLNLRLKDVRDDRLHIIAAKGQKDRVVALPHALTRELREQMQFATAKWERDVLAKIPVALPGPLAQKYPEYRFARSWAWVFPAHHPCQNAAGEWVRWRCHEANVQRAIKAARRKLGIMILPHELRHAYATHCLERGVNIKALQEAMGHEHAETTLGYCHADALSVRSPLELLDSAGAGGAGQSHNAICDQSHNTVICEPFKVSELRALGTYSEEEGIKLLTQKLSEGWESHNAKLVLGTRPDLQFSGPGHEKHHRLRELVREAFAVVGEVAQKAYGGWYWNRAKENPEKFERVLAAVRCDKRERPQQIHNWGGHFHSLWNLFA